MGIKSYAVLDRKAVELVDPNDEQMVGDDGKLMIVTICSPGTKQYARAQAAQQNRLLDKLKKKGKANESAEEKARESAEFLADCTISFSPNIGSDYPGVTGRELLLAVYSDREIGFVADQIAAELRDWAGFTKSSTESSPSTHDITPG